MLVSRENCGFGLSTALIEPYSNKEASSYITSNYNKLIKIIRSLQVSYEKAQDLLHDVMISIMMDEQDGEGFDQDYAVKYGDGNTLQVEQFVINRIKLYAKNSRYSTNVIESARVYTESVHCIEEEVIGRNGKPLLDSRGNVVKERRYVKEKTQIRADLTAASFSMTNDSDDTGDQFQTAYALATAADEIVSVDANLSLVEEINYCIDICNVYDVKILNILKNIDSLATLLGDYSRKKKNSDSVFAKLSSIVETNKEFAEALTNVIRYSQYHKDEFNQVLSTRF